MDVATYRTASVAETERLGEAFGRRLCPGDVVAFTGDLGAGKTAFVRGVARGAGFDGEVLSPTFALVHEYHGVLDLYHFDMYRIASPEDLYTTGYYDYLDTKAVLLIEWSENIAEEIPADAIRIHLDRVSENERNITIEGRDALENFGS